MNESKMNIKSWSRNKLGVKVIILCRGFQLLQAQGMTHVCRRSRKRLSNHKERERFQLLRCGNKRWGNNSSFSIPDKICKVRCFTIACQCPKQVSLLRTKTSSRCRQSNLSQAVTAVGQGRLQTWGHLRIPETIITNPWSSISRRISDTINSQTRACQS